MSAVVRVKRRTDEDPLGALVLNCKRRRVDNATLDGGDNNREGDFNRENLFESRDEISTILKFAGTVETQDESIATQISRLTKDEAKQLAEKTRKPNILERSRQEMRQNIHENRFRVVNCYRTINNNNEDNVPQEITVVDIEKQGNSNAATPIPPVTINATSSQSNTISTSRSRNALAPETEGETSNAVATTSSASSSSSSDYVYDIYVPENEQQLNGVDYVDTYLSVRPFDDLIYEDNYKDDTDDNDSEDSNRENYYRNDYPDTEEDNSSVNDDDMRRAVEDLDLEGERELSTDDEYQDCGDYIHSVDPYDDKNFDNDIDFVCVDDDSLGVYQSRTKKKKNKDYDDYDSELDNEDYYYEDSD